MKIKAILELKPTVSFEVFPPKQWDKIEGTKAVVKEMVKSHPAFMSQRLYNGDCKRDPGRRCDPTGASDLPDLYPG